MASINIVNTPVAHLSLHQKTIMNNLERLPPSLPADIHVHAQLNASISCANANEHVPEMGKAALSSVENYLTEQVKDALHKRHGAACDKCARKRQRLDQEMANTDSLVLDYDRATVTQLSARNTSSDALLSKPSITNNTTCFQNHIHTDKKQNDKWTFERTLCVLDKRNRLSCARGVATSNNNAFVVADLGSAKVKVFNQQGQLQVSMDTKSDPTQDQVSNIREVAVGLDNQCFVTDKTQFVRVFDATGKYLQKFTTCPPPNDTPSSDGKMLAQLSGLAIDDEDCLLVGEIKNKYVSRHSQDGSHLTTIQTSIAPWYLASLHGQIIISSSIEQTVQVVDQSGRLLHTLQGPDNWMPTGVCCSLDTIYVCNFASDCNGVYAFSASGEYLGCVTKEVSDPTGVALVDGGKKLVVAQWGRAGVQLFRRS